ncbi:MAG: hypothetical protein HY507_00775 [Candidatus Zambryskibacteria bacterium]|nr:hypothetical protein [Candidatus Zambryskibacteria bacterium]
MSKIIAPITETITLGQIGRASDRFSERCRTNAVSLPRDTVQLVLEDEGDALAQEMFEALRTRVERRSEMVIRHVKMDRTKTPRQMIEALGRTEYITEAVLATMPTEGKDEDDIYFFPLKRFVPVGEMPAELDARGLSGPLCSDSSQH